MPTPPDASITAGIQGLAIYHYQPTTTTLPAIYGVATANGQVYTIAGGGGFTGTSQFSGVSDDNLSTIVQFKNVMLITDQVRPPLMLDYNNGTPFVAAMGVPSPNQNKLIEGFEDVTDWSVVAGAGTITADLGQFIQGYQSITFTQTSGSQFQVYKSIYPAINLATFLDGSASSTADLIRLQYCVRSAPTDFNSFWIILATSSGSYYQYALSGDPQWTNSGQNYVAFDFKIPKSAFTAIGTPSWANITGVEFVLYYAAAWAHPSVTLDGLYLWKAPITATVGSSAGNLNGLGYTYVVTYINRQGEESDASLPSNSVDVTNGTVDLTHIPISADSRVVGRRIYRIGGTSTDYLLDAELVGNTLQALTDNVADTDMGVALTDVSGQPMICRTMCTAGEYVVIANLTGTDGVLYPTGIQTSNEHSYNIFNVENMLTINERSGEQIVWVHYEFNKVFVGMSSSIWSYNPADLTVLPVCETQVFNAIAVNGVTSGKDCFYFMSNKAIIRCDGYSFADVSTPWVRTYLEQIPNGSNNTWLYNWQWLCWMEYFEDTLYVGVPWMMQDGSGTMKWTILCYYVPTQAWFVFQGWNALTSTTMNFPSTGPHWYLGGYDAATFYEALYGDDDAGTPIECTFATKVSDFGEPDTLKDFIKLFLITANLSTYAVQLTVEFWVDTTSASVSDAQTLLGASATHQRIELPAPSLGKYGTYLGVHITSVAGRWMLRSLTQVVRMLASTY